jgi:hypothetical protein
MLLCYSGSIGNDGGQPKGYLHVFRMSSESQEMLADELEITSPRGLVNQSEALLARVFQRPTWTPVQPPELRSSIKPSSRQHLTQNYLNHFRPMLASRTFQRIRPFEAIRAHNLHLPAVIALGTEDRNSPNSRPIGKHMFDDRSNFRLQTGISRVLQLH